MLFAGSGCVEIVTPSPETRYTAVAAGGDHSCALDSEGRAWCWGSNSEGQLGVSSRHRSDASPLAVDTEVRFRALAAGERHSCAIDIQDRVWCWGANDSGQLGDGSTDDRGEPRPVRLFRPVSAIGAGSSHSCASDAGGGVWCWGLNDHGQVGSPAGGATDAPIRVEGAPMAGSVAAGFQHSCAIGAAGAFCWGANDHLQLGGATLRDSHVPVRVSAPGILHRVAAGWAHSCALAADQEVLCWGANEQGQLGIPGAGPAGTAVKPLLPRGGYTAVKTSPAGALTCVAQGSQVWCWGSLRGPELGAVGGRPAPVAGLPAGAIADLAVGPGHACALIGGRISCWGNGSSGQLGNGQRASSWTPVQVGGG